MFEQNPQLPNPQLSDEKPFRPSSNEITSVRIKQPIGQMISIISIIILVAAILVGGYFFIADRSGKKELKELIAKKESLNSEYSNPANQKIITLSDQIISRVTIFKDLFDRKIDWPKIFTLLTMESYRNLNYTSISINKDLTVTLAGNTPDSNSFAKAYRGWQQSDLVNTVSLGSFEKSDNEKGSAYYSFSINITLDKEAFGIKAVEDESATATGEGTAAETATPAATTTTTTPTQ